MFEYQGWATLRPNFRNSERHDQDTYPDGFHEVLAWHVGGLNTSENQIATVVTQNGTERVFFHGDTNHAANAQPKIEAFLDFLVENAEGSYGEFSFIDWSGGDAERWILRRGMLIRGPHPEFLPLQPNIEDAFTPD